MNISDAKNAGLASVLDLEKAMLDFQAKWNAPDVLRRQAILSQILLNQWDALSPEINQVKAQSPDVYKGASTAIQALRDRLAGKPIKQ